MLDSNGKPVKNGTGGKVEGLVDTYQFADGVVERLSYEALAVRIGDALTNNDHALVNQYYGEITFNSTDYSNQSNTQQIIEALIASAKSDSAKTSLQNASPENIVATLLEMDDGLQDAAFAETKHSSVEDSVTFEINGETRNDSQPFVLGENNQTYRVEATDRGIDVVVSVKDTEAVPYSTLFAIQERAGELTSKGLGILTEGSDGFDLTLVIEIDSSAPESIKSLYEQYAAYYESDDRIKVKIVEK